MAMTAVEAEAWAAHQKLEIKRMEAEQRLALASITTGIGLDDVTLKEMQHVVFNTPIQVLLDAWGQRYGDEWVNREAVLKDEFFSIAYKRLKKLGRIEVHFLIDRNEHVCRKVPDEHL